MEKSNRKTAAKAWAVIALFAVAAVLSAVFMGKVVINYDLADYLGADTQTKIALDIIGEDFGVTGNLQVMARQVAAETADSIRDTIEAVPHVLHVNFDRYDTAYYKDGNALFIVIIDGDDYSDNAKQVAADVQAALSAYEGMEYGGTTVEKQNLQDAITQEMVYILAVSLCLVVAILLITSESWLEPFVLLAASGVAILINRGTNVFFGEISYITNSIAAILQLALSIDYSIVLLHTYRRERATARAGGEAMERAIRSVLRPVSASALTTIAGLLALLFMSFRIGFDIGIVLMKGIVISAITSVTLLPALVLLLGKLLQRTHKRTFVPRGRAFCKIAYKANRVIVPLVLVLVVLCGYLQTGNRYRFTDTKAANTAITDAFGNHNSVVVVYPNSDDRFEKEKTLTDALYAYRTKDGEGVLTSYTAYTDTVREWYDTEKAVQKLEISAHDAELLFTMYNLYRQPDCVKLTFADFVHYANGLLDTDEDVKDFVDGDTTKTLRTLQAVSEIMQGDFTAGELYKKLTTGAMEGTDVRLFSLEQLYGLYFYDRVAESAVDFRTMLAFVTAASESADLGTAFDAATAAQLKTLSAAIGQFETQMETPMDAAQLRGWLYQNGGVLLDDGQLAQIFGGYFTATGEPQAETVPFLPLMKFLVASGQLADPTAAASIRGYDTLDQVIRGRYGCDRFLPTLAQVATALSGTAPQMTVTGESVQQLYIRYFYETGRMPVGRMSGKTFAEYALDAAETNAAVRGQLTDANRDKLTDMLTVYRYVSDTSELDFNAMYERLSALQGAIRSDMTSTTLEKDNVSGVFIKYATNGGNALTAPMMACDLLDFVVDNMDTNALLKRKMTAENRDKVTDAQADIDTANDLFLGETYSRMLLSVNLPNEGADTTAFVEYLSAEAKTVFGDGAYITGEIVSTYDLEKSFDYDNRLITIFTLVSIFVIVLVVFRSLSLPVILVAIIQGAIFIAMSTQRLGNGIFFMSYIVTTCILMGATIDYGILMSSSYVEYRGRDDKRQALARSVEAAMPTVFTSGTILTVCGFVIQGISSQNSISTVGRLIGIGTVCSVVMITVVLPSVLYLLDGFVMRLSMKKKK